MIFFSRWGNKILTFSVVMLVSVTSLVTYASWSHQTSMSAGVITAGNIDLALGEQEWVNQESHSPGFRTVEVTQVINSMAVGDNLVVALGVEYTDLPVGTLGSWHFSDSDGVTHGAGEVELGDQVVVTFVDGLWVGTATITLQIPGEQVTWGDPLADELDDSSVGTLTITATQVRCGAGFSTTCPQMIKGG
jgi:hypothetical protein